MNYLTLGGSSLWGATNLISDNVKAFVSTLVNEIAKIAEKGKETICDYLRGKT